MSRVRGHPTRIAAEPNGGIGANDDGNRVSERLTRVETMLEHTPTQQDIGDIRASIEAVKSLIAEKQTSALRWSIVTLAGAVAALAGLIVAFRP